MTIVIRSVFEEHGSFYSQAYLDKFLYELRAKETLVASDVIQKLEYDRIDISECYCLC